MTGSGAFRVGAALLSSPCRLNRAKEVVRWHSSPSRKAACSPSAGSIQSRSSRRWASSPRRRTRACIWSTFKGARDPRVRTIRIDDNSRGVLRAPVRGDTYLLVDVRPHDEPNRLARLIAFKANTATGAIQVWDVEAVEELHDTLTDGSAGTAARANYFDRFPDKDLDRLGLDEQSISLLRAAPDLPPEAIADMVCSRLPTPEADVVTMLASGYTVEEAWKEVVGDQPRAGPSRRRRRGHHPPRQHGLRARRRRHRGTGRRPALPARRVGRVPAPSQRKLAHRPAFSGPARITGGPGTGKTVVAVRRDKALADDAALEDRILFTTFTRTLAESIEASLERLGGADLAHRVDVRNVDRIAHQVVHDHLGSVPTILKGSDEAASGRVPSSRPTVRLPRCSSARNGAGSFSRTGWRQSRRTWKLVVAAAASDLPRVTGGRCGAPSTPSVPPSPTKAPRSYCGWPIPLPGCSTPQEEPFTGMSSSTRRRTCTRPTGGCARSGRPRPQRHVHRRRRPPANLRAPREPGRGRRSTSAAAAPGSRSTTAPPRRFSAGRSGFLPGPVTTTLTARPTPSAYRSQLHGERSNARGYRSREEEFDGLADTVRRWLDAGVEPRTSRWSPAPTASATRPHRRWERQA